MKDTVLQNDTIKEKGRTMERKTKRILVISDLHCGHHKGLTPPDWHWSTSDNPYRQSVCDFQRWSWDKYTDILNRNKPFDILFANGDMIDGKGDRSGGTELLTTDRDEQADMAAECIKPIGARKKIMTYGTPYHTGASEDWENVVAHKTKSQISSHAYADVNGVVISLKHKIGSSSVPHGKATALLKQAVSNDEWCREYEEHPRATVFIRSHCHYYTAIDMGSSYFFRTPALQGMGSKYGARQCEGVVHWGAIIIEITPAGSLSWHKELTKLEGQPVETLIL